MKKLINKIMPTWLIETNWGLLIVAIGAIAVLIFNFAAVNIGAFMGIPGLYLGIWIGKRMDYLDDLKEK